MVYLFPCNFELTRFQQLTCALNPYTKADPQVNIYTFGITIISQQKYSMEGVIPLLYLTTVNEPLYLSQTSGLIYSYYFKDIPQSNPDTGCTI